MSTYLISYDLNKPVQNYAALIDAIKRIADGWWHQLDSTWILRCAGTSAAIRDALLPFIDRNDELLVVELTGNAAWYGFGPQGDDWLKTHL